MNSEKNEFKSSWFMQGLFKFMPVIFGLIFLMVGLVLLFVEVAPDEKGEPFPPNAKYGFIAAGIPLIAIYFAIKDKFGVVFVHGMRIELERNSNKREEKWSDVRTVMKLPFCSPPIYRMSFKDGERPIYFVFGSLFIIMTPLYSYDFTGFLPFAKRRLREAANLDENKSYTFRQPAE